MSTDLEPETIVALCGEAAARAPAAPALVAPARAPLSHGALHAHVGSTAAALRTAGLARDDVAALVVDNGPEAASAFLALAAAAVCAPLNPAYRETELDFYLGDLGARLVVVGRHTVSPVRAVAARRGVDVVELATDPDAPAGSFDLAGLAASNGRAARTRPLRTTGADAPYLRHDLEAEARPADTPPALRLGSERRPSCS
jgi:acyl-CoA synthetase (AMP-forming)/AMP-acid ligase II